MPQAAMLYARLRHDELCEGRPSSFNAASGNAIRATLSLAAREFTGPRQRFSQPSRFPIEKRLFFVDTVFSKSPKTSCQPLIFNGSSCPRFFVATSPVFRGKNEKIISSPSIASIRTRGKKFVACRRFCTFLRCEVVSLLHQVHLWKRKDVCVNGYFRYVDGRRFFRWFWWRLRRQQPSRTERLSAP